VGKQMIKIGIIGAMNEEVDILKNKMEIKKVTKKANMEFYEGLLNNKQVVIVECGIGKVNAAACTQILISEYKVNYIINTGVAGAVNDDLEIGDIVISTDVVQHDFDVTAFGYKLGEIPRLNDYIFKADNRLIELAKKITIDVTDHKVFIGRIMSGDIFLASPESKDKLQKEFNGYCVEMESAAIGQICYLNSVPFVIFRAMSDKADGSAHENFNDFVQKAAINSANIVINMINHI